MKQVKVFIFSQQPLLRAGIAQALSGQEGIQILGQAGITENVMLTIEVMPPDIAILDIDSHTGNGINLAQRLKRLTPNIAIVTMTSKPNDEQLFQLI